MRGTHNVIVQNKRIRYDFDIRRNLTIIQGDSATGKTILIDMIQEYYENGSVSGIDLRSDKECVILSGRKWENDLKVIQDSIVFIDEGNEFVFTDEFAAIIKNTDNYYVIVTREGIPSLPYSIEEIYGIRDSGKYGVLKQVYNKFFHIYQGNRPDQNKFDMIITEDSNSGYQFFKATADERNIICESAGGKSNIFSAAAKAVAAHPKEMILVIADGAAFGAEMEKITRLIADHGCLVLYVPESFEWLILKSGIVEDKEITNILEAPGEYIESQKYFSWERFFTSLLVSKTEKTYLKYMKKVLNPSYLNNKVKSKIFAVLPVDF